MIHVVHADALHLLSMPMVGWASDSWLCGAIQEPLRGQRATKMRFVAFANAVKSGAVQAAHHLVQIHKFIIIN